VSFDPNRRKPLVEYSDSRPVASPAPGTESEAVAHSGRPLTELVDYREAVDEEDTGFIRKNWLRITRHNEPSYTTSETFYREHDLLIGKIAQTDRCIIACDKEHPFYIYGYVCGYPTQKKGDVVVHFIFTRDEWRKRGVARGLLEQLGLAPGGKIHATHWSHFLKPRMLANKNIEYNRYLLPSVHR
jgi:hypothetical protein